MPMCSLRSVASAEWKFWGSSAVQSRVETPTSCFFAFRSHSNHPFLWFPLFKPSAAALRGPNQAMVSHLSASCAADVVLLCIAIPGSCPLCTCCAKVLPESLCLHLFWFRKCCSSIACHCRVTVCNCNILNINVMNMNGVVAYCALCSLKCCVYVYHLNRCKISIICRGMECASDVSIE